MKRMFALIAALAFSEAAHAGVLTYSGYLRDAGGEPVSVATPITFRFYPGPAGGAAVWEDTVTVLPDADGWFSALLGASALNPLAAAAFGEPLWLALQVSGDALEMSPRTAVGTAPYALTVDWAGVAGKPAAYPVDPAVVQSRVTGACGAGQFIRAVNQDGTVACADESVTAYVAGAGIDIAGSTLSLSTAGCVAGEVWKYGAAGWSCEPDADTNTTYTATGAIALSAGGTFSLSTTGCVAGEVWKYNGMGGWSCEADFDTYTIRLCAWAVATGAVSSSSQTAACPAGKYPISGGCEGAGGASVRIGRPGGPPADAAAWTGVTQWYCEFSAAATGHKAYALCCNN